MNRSPLPLFVMLLTLTQFATPASTFADELADLRREKIVLAERWWKAAIVNEGEEFTYQPAFRASLALKDAELEMAATDADRLLVLQRHLERMTGLHQQIKPRFVVGAPGGSAVDMDEVDYRLKQAQIWAVEQQARRRSANK